jgi:hypothetical protein
MKSASDNQHWLRSLIQAAIGGDVLTEEGGGFVAVMAQSNPHIRQDIPSAFEMYTLLDHFLTSSTISILPRDDVIAELTPSILIDQEAERVIALISIPPLQLELIAFWLSEGLRSQTVKNMPGTLAMPFSIEVRDGVQHLIPEWFAAFYVDGKPEHCVPILALKSVTCDDRFGDWVSIALERMQHFSLPCTLASDAVKKATQSSHKPPSYANS